MSRKNAFYESKSTRIHRLNPITKLYGLAWFLLLSFLSPSVSTTITLFCVVVVATIMAQSFQRVFRLVVALIVPVLLFLSFVHGFLNPKNETILYSMTLWGITAELGKEGLLITYNLVSKLCLILPAVFLFVNTTSQERLMPNLIKKGVSPSVSYLFLATLNVLPFMREKMETIKIAQQTRGISMEGNLITRTRAFLPLLMPLILSSLTDIQSRGVTLEVRSFGVSRQISSLYNLEEKRSDVVLQRLFLLTAMAAIIASITYKLGVWG